MNKKEAVAYAQIALDYMQSPKYKGLLNPYTLGVEMKQAFNIYPRDLAVIMANNMESVERDLINKKMEE